MPATSDNNSQSLDVALHGALLREFGFELTPACRVLDFGCGDGTLVREYRNAHFEAFGVDIVLRNSEPFLFPIHADSYRIPFDDRTFDFVFSNYVVEHVRNLSASAAEIFRVLKPGGVSLHFLPPKATPIEPHVFVPFATVVKGRPWLTLWALLGIRNAHTRGMSALAAARSNFEFLRDETFYRTKRELRASFSGPFPEPVFADMEMLKHSYAKARYLYPLAKRVPLLASCYGTFLNRCLFVRRPR